MKNKKLKFIDLFAGIGGFHLALKDLGHECVFASEMKEPLAKQYKKNFDIVPNRDITKIPIENIPHHNILCAGFPCQPFSKAGKQLGLNDERNGTLFDRIVNILEFHKPEYFILENVRTLVSHDDSNTWLYIQKQLVEELNYTISKNIFSPHEFGIPQHRERLFIVGAKAGLDQFTWPEINVKNNKSIHSYLSENPSGARKLETEKVEVLKIWQEFLNEIPKEESIPGFPIWSMEFGATYKYEGITPYYATLKSLKTTKGRFGTSLNYESKGEIFKHLPKYALNKQRKFPNWKKNYIRKNRAFYLKHEQKIKEVVQKIKNFKVASWQKFEWNVQNGERDLSKYIIQFRGSGVRIKKTDFFPSLVTVSTQIPIIGWEGRYITPEEGAKLQSIEGIELPQNEGACFSALGNAVNVQIVKKIAKELIK